MTADFLMPKLGADMSAGKLLAWRKKPGDTVQRGDIIAEVETDKADIEVEVFTGGVIEQLVVEPGTKVAVGALLAKIRTDGAEPSSPASPSEAPVAPLAPTPVVPHAPASRAVTAAERLRISPAARLRARELGIDPGGIAGTGPEGRITLKDLDRATARPSSPPGGTHLRITPAARKHAEALGVDWTGLHGTGPGDRIIVEDVEHAAALRAAVPTPPPAGEDRAIRMRQAIAAAMARSKREIPHYYLSTTVDMKSAVTWLAEENARRSIHDRLLIGVLLLKAVALALRETPELNGFWIDEKAAPGTAIHVGVAISLRGGGLVAPALHDTDQQSLDELMRRFRELVRRARAGSLRSSEISDPTITVTSLGEQGAESVLGVIYPPQVAIVGFGKVVERPWAVDAISSRGHHHPRRGPPRDRRPPWRSLPRRGRPPLAGAGEAMSDDEIRATVLRLLGAIAPEADLPNLRPDAPLRDQLDIDSMDFLNLLIALDEELKIEIPEADYRQLATLDGLVGYLSTALAVNR